MQEREKRLAIIRKEIEREEHAMYPDTYALAWLREKLRELLSETD